MPFFILERTGCTGKDLETPMKVRMSMRPGETCAKCKQPVYLVGVREANRIRAKFGKTPVEHECYICDGMGHLV
jgi:hypothetical protein